VQVSAHVCVHACVCVRSSVFMCAQAHAQVCVCVDHDGQVMFHSHGVLTG